MTQQEKTALDRDQVQRYLEALLALSSVERVQAVVEDPSLLDYVGALLAELQQAEKERDDLETELIRRLDNNYVDEQLSQSEARLAKVPALVEAASTTLKEYDLWAEDATDGEFAIWSRDRFMASFLSLRAALSGLDAE